MSKRAKLEPIDPRYGAFKNRGEWCFGTSDSHQKLACMQPNMRTWKRFVRMYGIDPPTALAMGKWRPVPIAVETGARRWEQ